MWLYVRMNKNVAEKNNAAQGRIIFNVL